MPMQPNAYGSYLVTAIIVAIVLFLRLRRMGRVQRLRLEQLWIVPAIYGAVAAFVLYQSMPVGMQWIYAGIALAAGAVIGWRRGKLMRITIDPETHALNQQASPLALVVILMLVMARFGLRAEAARTGFNAAFATDLLVLSAFGLLAATRLEMFLRARRLLADARAPTPGMAG